MNPLFPYEKGFKPTWAGKPRGLVSEEVALWQWWRRKYGDMFDEYWFDVLLDGQPAREEILPAEAATLTPKWRRLWKKLTSKRADVIGRRGSTYEVIEIRYTSGPQTLGELDMYINLVKSEFPDLGVGKGIIITKVIDNILLNILRRRGVRVFVPKRGEGLREGLQANDSLFYKPIR